MVAEARLAVRAGSKVALEAVQICTSFLVNLFRRLCRLWLPSLVSLVGVGGRNGIRLFGHPPWRKNMQARPGKEFKKNLKMLQMR